MAFESKSMFGGMEMAVLLAIALADPPTTLRPTTQTTRPQTTTIPYVLDVGPVPSSLPTTPTRTPTDSPTSRPRVPTTTTQTTSTTRPPSTTPHLTTTTTADYLGMFLYNDPQLCDICTVDITLCNMPNGCTAMFQCEGVGDTHFTHCNPIGDSVPCSETGGGLRLVNQVKVLVKKQRKQLKKLWPCFKGVLSGIKMFAINVDFCKSIYGPAGAAIVQEMRILFKAKEWTVTRILTHIAMIMRGLTTDSMGLNSFMSSGTYSNHFADLLDSMAKTVGEMTNDDLKKSLGPKCFKRLSKRCI